jgi:hypothetical protein
MFQNTTMMRKMFLLSLLVVTLAACGSVEVDLEATATTASDIDSSGQPPDEIVSVLHTAIDQLRVEFPADSPDRDADWQAQDIATPGLVGSGGYRFTIEGWQIDITYPIVAPESMVYTITADQFTSGLHWKATVDSQGLIQTPVTAIAWPGRVSSGSDGDTLMFDISGGAGTIEMTSSDESVLSNLQAVRDDNGPDGFVHLWGRLECNPGGVERCRLEVTRVRRGTEITEAEPVNAWEGVIYARTGPPGSGGDDYFVLIGSWPIQYGIWAMDDGLREQLESLRDSGQVIRIWGEIVAGLPDWNGTQIRVTSFEVVDQSFDTIPPSPTP